jgi:NhaA family Na+:H+ antiporter
MHESGVHATIAGVALGLLARVRPDPGEEAGPAERLAHRLHPVSAGIAVPVFAFTATAIDLRSLDVAAAVASPVFLGVAIGLLIGKPVGIVVAARLAVALGRSSLADGVGWWDIAIVGVLAGVGFTVSLLVAELAYPSAEVLLDAAKLGVFAASIAAAGLAAVLLTLRGRR